MFLTSGHRGRAPFLLDRTVIWLTTYGEWALSVPIDGIAGGFSGYVWLRGPREKNARLEAENGRILEQLHLLEAARLENDPLSRMLGYLEGTGGPQIRARVVGVNPDAENPSLRINRGELDGVQRGMAVVTSRSYDGEFIARTIEKLGYTAVRGSSSRGGVGALLGMHDVIERGNIAVFTIDGPRGPRHVAKPGAILLAKNTGRNVYCTHAAVESKWRLNAWDKMMITKPFTRAYARVARPIVVPPDADAATMKRLQAEMQVGWERVTQYAEARFLPKERRVRASAD